MLQPTTLKFLLDLKKNNNKPWFEAHRKQFETAKLDFDSFISNIITKFGKHDKDIAPLEAKNCVYRQYRDVRFSKDKTPYKHHMGASMERGGKNSGFAGYYFHCEPGNNSIVGGGLWMPPADALKKVRQEIDYCYDEFLSIINNKSFKSIYGDLERGEYALTREPKGYEKDNPAISYLKLKSFVASRPLSDKELVSGELEKIVIQSYAALQPLIMFINRALEDHV
jgi:uncharacterized protein (TIGR02453 family)